MRRTPLFAAHQRLGARLVEFGGWEMPVQYSSIVDEHQCVRRASGIFDIAHMGQIEASGPEAGSFLNQVLTNDVQKLSPGVGQYTFICNGQGGVIDDLYVYQLAPEQFLLIVNASRTEADWAWLQQQRLNRPQPARIQLINRSGQAAAVAIQGPRVVEFLEQLFPGPSISGAPVQRITDLRKNQIARWKWEEREAWAARTGYSGEDGFEVGMEGSLIESFWNRALAVGHLGCLQPCGLGARDTLRTEMGYPLYGHELDEATSPLEAGLGVFVALDKGDFIGRKVLSDQKQNGTPRKLAAFRMAPKAAPPRPGYRIWGGGSEIGVVVSGTQSPSLGVGIGMGYVPPGWEQEGRRIEIEIRGRRFDAEVARRPLYRKPAKQEQGTARVSPG